MMRRFLFFCAVALFLVGALSASAQEKLRLTVSISPLADIVGMVGGRHVHIHTLIKAGRNPHNYEPSPKDLMAIEKSDAVVIVGMGLEHWLEKLISMSGGKKERVTIDCDEAVAHPVIGVGHEQHSHGTENPHYWLDPIIVIDVVDLLVKKLSAIRPDLAGEFEKNGSKLKNDLNNLDIEITEMLQGKNIAKEFVAFHNSWDYFARRYGLNPVGVIETTPGRKPSAKLMVELVKKIKKYNVRAVMVEPQFSPQLGKTLAQETGVKVVTVDPLGMGEGYLNLMYKNARQFAEGLKNDKY